MARATQRPASQVPRVIVAALIVFLAAQLLVRSVTPPAGLEASDLPKPPGTETLRLAALGDPIPLAKVLMLYLQAFDFRAANRIPYQSLDYSRVESWLDTILALDPSGQYPLMAASRLYAEVPQPDKQRRMLEFIYREFFKDPDRRWRWLAHATFIAKHRLGDLPLARTYAAAIQQHATGDQVPLWAKQMEAFILEDMNELETARVMIGGFIEKGLVKDAAELRFLELRLKEIEARTGRN